MSHPIVEQEKSTSLGVDELTILEARPITARRRFLRRFRANRSAMVAFGFVVFLILVALVGPWVAPQDPNATDLSNRLASPFSDGHILGTDDLGRDVLSRLIYATRVAMLAASQAVGIAMLLGVPTGLVAGYFGGRVDLAVMRITDAVQAFPPLILAISIVGVLGPGLSNAMLAIGIVFAPGLLRILRASVLEIREETFIEASRSIGTPASQIIRKRILPNVLPPLLVQVSLAAGFSLLAEAGLSFLGLGVQPPQSSWGSMLTKAQQFIEQQPWLAVVPGVTIAASVLAFNLLGDGLRDAIGREVRREQ